MKEIEIVKIKTLKNRIITLRITRKTDSHLFGVDKFGHDVILNKDTIDTMFPVETRGSKYDL